MTPKAKLALAAVGALLAAAVIYKVATVTNGETRYQRPGPNAGAQAVEFWQYYWTDPNADANRCYFPRVGGWAPAHPPQPPVPCTKPVSCAPHAPAASGVFNPRIYACSFPQGCYMNQAGVETALGSPTQAGYVKGIGSSHGACIIGLDGVCYGLVDQCPNQPATPTPRVSTTPVPTPPPAPTATPSGPTPVCVRVTVTPASICVPATPTGGR